MSDSHTLDRLLDPGIRPRRPAADPNTPRPTVLPDFTADTTAEATRDSEGPANSIPDHQLPDDDYTAFAHGRISRHPQMMLALHQASGEVEVLPYSLLTRIHSPDPSTTITLTFGPDKVELHGHNLTRLYQHLCQHQAATITQSDRTAAFTNEDDCVVTEIRVITAKQTADNPASRPDLRHK